MRVDTGARELLVQTHTLLGSLESHKASLIEMKV